MALVKINGITKEYPEGTTWMEVAGEHQKEYEYDILLVRVNGKLQDLIIVIAVFIPGAVHTVYKIIVHCNGMGL